MFDRIERDVKVILGFIPSEAKEVKAAKAADAAEISDE